MSEKPSFCTSTLSLLVVCCTLTYLGACAWLVVKPVPEPDKVLAPLRWIVEALVIGYFVRGTKPPPPPEATPAPTGGTP